MGEVIAIVLIMFLLVILLIFCGIKHSIVNIDEVHINVHEKEMKRIEREIEMLKEKNEHCKK